MVGGASGSGDSALLSVSKYLFGKVCPNSTVILEDVNTERMRFSEMAPLTETFDAGFKCLKEATIHARPTEQPSIRN